MYRFDERKTPKPFVVACDKFISLENLTYDQTATTLASAAAKPPPRHLGRETHG